MNMKTVDLKMMTDSQEKISYLLQPLLEIAEQNRDIEEWNTHAESLLEVVQSLLDKQKQEERNRITQICEEVRDECRESDDQWDKGDECERIKNKLEKQK